ncbi:MAG: hypothetical protein V1658_02035 [Candidatus Micrarchaeota archaeon]
MVNKCQRCNKEAHYVEKCKTCDRYVCRNCQKASKTASKTGASSSARTAGEKCPKGKSGRAHN